MTGLSGKASLTLFLCVLVCVCAALRCKLIAPYPASVSLRGASHHSFAFRVSLFSGGLFLSIMLMDFENWTSSTQEYARECVCVCAAKKFSQACD